MDNPKTPEPAAEAAAASGAERPTLEELGQLIAAFDASAAKLKASHDALQERVDELTGELSRKNAELQAALDETSSLKNYLANILESITDGVITIGAEQELVAHNQAAVDLVPGLAAAERPRPLLEILPDACRPLGELLVDSFASASPRSSVEVAVQDAAGERRILSVSCSPLRDERGSLVGAVATFRDLTPVKALEEALERKERLAALGEMAAGVAHEIRNPLGGIELYASALRRALPEGGREAELCRKIGRAAGSLERIVTDMLTFTRGRDPALRSVPAGRVCRAALEMAAKAIEEKGIDVRLDLDAAPGRTPLDADLVGRALLNVVLNAVQAMEPGGRLSLAAAETVDEEGRSVLELRVADTGPGIPPEALEKIFHPFFTLRRDGTGLGLAIVHKIVQDHGGTVRVETNAPHGAIFVFRFPRTVPEETPSHAE